MPSFTRRSFLHHGLIGAAGLRCAASALLPACASGRLRWQGVDASSGQRISLQAGPMPSGASSFTGHYRSPQLGELWLEQDGPILHGEYRARRDQSSVVGVLNGAVHGNFAELIWRETQPGADDAHGRGFFLLDHVLAPRARVRLFGERSCAVLIPSPGPRRPATTQHEPGQWSAIRIDAPDGRASR